MRIGSGDGEIHPLAIIVPVTVAIVLLLIRLFILMRVRHKRQREARQESERLKFLVVAYRSLAGSFSPATGDHRAQMEEALADVVLFGTLEQVELAAAYAQALTRGEPVDFQPLIEALRADLRSQLGLDPIPETLQIPHSGPGRLMRFSSNAGGGGGSGGRNKPAP